MLGPTEMSDVPAYLRAVTILEPDRTTIEPGVEVGADSVIHPDVTLLGATRVGSGCELHPMVANHHQRATFRHACSLWP